MKSKLIAEQCADTCQLGIPTANIPPSGLSAYPDLKSGVYYGYVGLMPPQSTTASTYPAVLSIGYNPFYNNATRSVEIHILHQFRSDFYGASLNLLMLGFIRPEYDYVSKESLIDDIKMDCDVASKSMKRPTYAKYEGESWLKEFAWREQTDVSEVEKEVLNQK